MGAPMIPCTGSGPHYEPLVLQFGKSALDSCLADAQCVRRFIHRQAHSTVVAAVEARVQFEKDFDGGP